MLILWILVPLLVVLVLNLLSDRFQDSRADPDYDADELARTERRIADIEREAEERRRR
ncbi:MAG: hypothetical protein JOZ90_00490 [Alphaproteobacteria bacterium]|nr:hypothetical protein [Alphaproteobacteria bacterium]